MKNSLCALTMILMSVATAFSQETAVFFSNPGKSPGLTCEPAAVHFGLKGNRFFEKPVSKVSNNPYAPSPLAGEAYKNRVAAPQPVDEPVKEISPVVQSEQIKVSQANAGKYLDPAWLQQQPTATVPKPRQPSLSRPTANLSMKGYTTGNLLVDSFIVDSSRRYSIDPLLIYAQMHMESAFKLKAKSHKGASGLMQLMPATARRLGVTDIYDPQQNIDGGVKYMRMLLNMFSGNVNLALAGYNAGEGAVMKYGYQIPPYRETQEYVKRISSKYKRISGSTMQESSSPVTARASVYSEQVEHTVPPPPSGWESGTEMMQRYARSKAVDKK